MCGIAGILGFKNKSDAIARLQKMTVSLARRGPDGEGVEVWGNCVLGHRRLSIFDLSEAGKQPMLSGDGNCGVVFNGAIYNFLELRRELEQNGYQFRSQTDTEILIYGYRHWGFDELVRKLRGMFAIGLWDEAAQRLFLVRDRLGVKPLAYTFKDGELAFASTVRALREANFTGGLDANGLAEFLEFGFLTAENSIYENVKKLPAATILEWHNGTIKTREFWTLPNIEEDLTINFADAVAETERLLLESVELRLQADVPVGALLSGGIDSSLICWAIKKLGGEITAFTIGTPDDESDESAKASSIAQFLKIKHQILPMTAHQPPAVGELVSAFAEPFAVSSALGMLRISETVKQHATVLLTGDGGDDVFLGYPEHKHFLLVQQTARKTPAVLTSAWQTIRLQTPRNRSLKRMASFLDYVSGGLAAVGENRDGWPIYQKNGLLGERLQDICITHRHMMWTKKSAGNLLTEFLNYDRETRFVGEYLPKVDGATMFHGLEARSPFLDQKIWEFASRLPYQIRLKGGNLKAILRELAWQKLGETVAKGKKQGFTVPVQKWLVSKWKENFDEVWQDSILVRDGWLESAAVMRLLENSAQNRIAPRQLWFIFVLENWLRAENDRD